jgi:chemotaxis protein MotC
MKRFLPRLPRFKIKLPKIRLGALRKVGRLCFPSVQMSKRLYWAMGGVALLVLGGLGWLAIRPLTHGSQTPLALDAAVGNEAKADAKNVETAKAEEKQEPAAAPASGAAEAAAKPAEEKPVPAPAEPAAPPGEVEDLVRQLHNLQEFVAGGDAKAYAEMPRQLRHVAQRLLAQPSDVWSRKANGRALVLYLLSGGQSAVGRKILSAHTLPPSEERLAKGAVAYLEGVDCAERDAMLELDARSFDMALGAQIAFVQSILLASHDRQKAIAQLDLARLLAPGGLVEEAALRREVGLVSETQDFAKFAALSRQYWSRFRRSPYADNFLHQFIGAVARVSVIIKIDQWAQLDEFIDSLSPERRLALYLVMAQAAAVAGNSAFADLAAQQASALAARSSVERQRALLYRAAAQVGEAGQAPDPNLLRDVERQKLPLADQPLYDATSMIAARIYQPPETSFDKPPEGAGDLANGGLARAEDGLREADAAIEKARKSMEGMSR